MGEERKVGWWAGGRVYLYIVALRRGKLVQLAIYRECTRDKRGREARNRVQCLAGLTRYCFRSLGNCAPGTVEEGATSRLDVGERPVERLDVGDTDSSPTPTGCGRTARGKSRSSDLDTLPTIRPPELICRCFFSFLPPPLARAASISQTKHRKNTHVHLPQADRVYPGTSAAGSRIFSILQLSPAPGSCSNKFKRFLCWGKERSSVLGNIMSL